MCDDSSDCFPLIMNYSIVTACKRSLGQGNVLTPVCHSVHRWKSLSNYAQQVTLPGVSIREGLCPGGFSVLLGESLARKGLCPRGSLSRGVSVRDTPSPPGRDPRTETSGQFTSIF